MRVPLVSDGCIFDQPIDLSHAHARTLSFQDSTLPALTAHELRVDGELNCHGVHAGTLDIFGARICGQLWLTQAHITAPPTEWAVNAPSMAVTGGVYGRGLTARGGVNLYGTEIGAALELNHATITAHDQPAVRAGNLIVRTDVHLNDTTATGSIDLFGARIGGQLWLNSAHVTASTGNSAIDGPSMAVTGGLYANGLTAHGGVNLWGTEIGAAVELDHVTITMQTGPALRGPRLSVRGDATLTDATIHGTVDLEAAAVGGTLTFAGAQLSSAELPTMNLATARLGALRLTAISGPDVSIDLRRATVSTIEDDPACWPQTAQIDGLSYDTLLPQLPAAQRLAWLAHDPDTGQPQPYQQLASHYRRAGLDHDARTVLLTRQRLRRRQLRLPARLWGHLQDVAVGYGYRPTRALAWLLALIAAVATYTATHPPRLPTASGPSFNPVAYAVDVVLPILDLGQEKAFLTSGVAQWITWVAALAGWVLATTVIAAISRILIRQ